jgi:hypothetical protein
MPTAQNSAEIVHVPNYLSTIKTRIITETKPKIFGVTLPGWAGQILGQGKDIWNPIFLWLGMALALAGLPLMPQWSRLPAAVK